MKKISHYIAFLILTVSLFSGCQKNQLNDTLFVSSAAAVTNLTATFNITHDNTGLVTIVPNGSGAVSYEIYLGDNSMMPVSVAAGQSYRNTYKEGTYQVKVVAHDLKGGTATVTVPLVVSFLAPQNLAVSLVKTNLSVAVSATAKYATFFKVYYGDSTKANPAGPTSFLAGQTVTHTYSNAGTYMVKVVALSGGSETSQHMDTIRVGKQINLPVTFSDPTVNYATTDFGGNNSSLAPDPSGSANQALKVVKTAGAETWAGTTIGTAAGFSMPVPLTAANKKMTVMVYSPAAGLDIKLKLDNHTNPNNGLSVETDVKTTVANKWELLTFDFANNADGTPAFSTSNTYDIAAIFFDFGKHGSGSVFYADNLQMAPLALKQVNIPVTYDDPSIDYSVTDFGNNFSVVTVDPSTGANHVLKTVKSKGAETWAGTTLSTVKGFATAIPLSANALKMTMMIYSPAAGLDIKLKLDNHTNPNAGMSLETDAMTTQSGQWEMLTFDLSQNPQYTPVFDAGNTYDLASIFLDYGNAGTGAVFYTDNLQMASSASTGLKQISLPVTFEDPSVDYTVTDFGNNSSVLMPDPMDASNHVMQSTKASGAATWAGTTIGTSAGFSSAIEFTQSRTKMSVQVYSPAAGLHIRLKVEDHNDPKITVETEALTTQAGQWETLTFDFTQPTVPATAPLNLNSHYDKASIFFDFGNPGSGSVFYWDNVMFL